MGKPEAEIEDYLVARCAEHRILCVKFTAPGTTGVSDRMMIGAGQVFFVELKARGQRRRATERQLRWGRQVRDRGVAAFVVDSREGVDELVELMLGGQADGLVQHARDRTPRLSPSAAEVGIRIRPKDPG